MPASRRNETRSRWQEQEPEREAGAGGRSSRIIFHLSFDIFDIFHLVIYPSSVARTLRFF